MPSLIKILIAFFTFMLLDGFWFLAISKGFYKSHLSILLRPFNEFQALQILSIVIIYVLLGSGMVKFVLTNTSFGSYSQIFFNGAFLGLVIYGVFNLTNFVILKDWPLIVLLVDLSWGIFSSAIASLFLHWVFMKIYLV